MSLRAHSKNLIALGLMAAGLWTAACRKPAAAAPPAPEVGIVTLQAQRLVLTTELPGRTSAYLVAEIRPQVNGIIQKRLFQEGALVGAGDILYQIDPAPYRSAYEQAQAALAMAEANLPAARSRAERLKGLADIHAVGQQDFDDASAALQRAEAGVAAAKAAMENARINLDYTPIRTPIAGRIGRSSVTPGALVAAYQPVPLAVVQQLDPIYVDVTQSSAELLRLRKALESGRLTQDGETHRRVKLLLEDGTPYAREGTLQFRDVTVDPSTGSVTLRMVFPNPDYLLLPGMFVRAELEEGINERAILVPQQGVSRDFKGNPVALVVNGAGVVEQKALELDRTVGDRWLVASGLAAGDRVIVDGLQRVRPGTAVTAVPFAGGTGGAPPSPGTN
jgi:membrane fusion protein (multidrug efflux system)